MGDWAVDVLVVLVALGLAVTSRSLWLRGRTAVATLLVVPVVLLVLLEAIAIWYTVTDGGGFNGM